MDMSDGGADDTLLANGSCDPPPFMNGSGPEEDVANGEMEDMGKIVLEYVGIGSSNDNIDDVGITIII